MAGRGGIYGDFHGDGRLVEVDCEDQALIATKHCTQCRTGFTSGGKPIYQALEKRGRYWCCPECGGSYGEHPHPDLN